MWYCIITRWLENGIRKKEPSYARKMLPENSNAGLKIILGGKTNVWI